MENRSAETIATRMFHYMHHKSSDSSRGKNIYLYIYISVHRMTARTVVIDVFPASLHREGL